MSMSLFDKITNEGTCELEDVCSIDGSWNNIMGMSLEGIPYVNPFPLEPSIPNIYSQVLGQRFENRKSHILETILSYLEVSDQVFEAETVLPEDSGYIRYLFPIPYAKSLIQQVKTAPMLVSVETLYLYTQYIELESNVSEFSEEPVIVFQYPYAYPSFFVLDGNHRVKKAWKEKQKRIEAFILPEGAFHLLVADTFFSLLYQIHQNMTVIATYRVGQITLEQLKKEYQPVANEQWL